MSLNDWPSGHRPEEARSPWCGPIGAVATTVLEDSLAAAAESEAREQRLRKAAREWHEQACENCGGTDSLSRAHAELCHALAGPADDSALRAYVAAAVRAAVDRVVAAARTCVAEWPRSTAEADEVIAVVEGAARKELSRNQKNAHDTT